MLTKAKKQKSDQSAPFTILEVQGMLKSLAIVTHVHELTVNRDHV